MNLLILSCSQRKLTSPGEISALDRYDGPTFRTIKRFRREGKLPASIVIAIVSSRYGLLSSKDTIPFYEEKLNKIQALALNGAVRGALEVLFAKHHFENVFVNLGKTYLLTVEPLKALIGEETRVIYAAGGIGQRTAQTRQWICNVNNCSNPLM